MGAAGLGFGAEKPDADPRIRVDSQGGKGRPRRYGRLAVRVIRSGRSPKSHAVRPDFSQIMRAFAKACDSSSSTKSCSEDRDIAAGGQFTILSVHDRIAQLQVLVQLLQRPAVRRDVDPEFLGRWKRPRAVGSGPCPGHLPERMSQVWVSGWSFLRYSLGRPLRRARTFSFEKAGDRPIQGCGRERRDGLNRDLQGDAVLRFPGLEAVDAVQTPAAGGYGFEETGRSPPGRAV